MFIPYGRQEITDDDINAILKVLKSDFLTQGPEINIFEKNVSNYVGADFGVSFNSATSALHAACSVVGLGSSDILWTSPITFVASANCGRYQNARVDFVDIDPETGNISLNHYRDKLKLAKKEGNLPKVLIPVHFGGASCDMEEIYKLSKKYGVMVIEDASHAIGGKYKGDLIGNCKYSDMTIFSFHPVKIITTAEGGMVTTNNKTWAENLSHFRTHGIIKNKSLLRNKEEGPWYYEQQGLGFNYRLNDIQAALGSSQLKRIDLYVSKRNQIAKKYKNELIDLPIKTLKIEQNCYSSYHLFVIRVDPLKRKEIFENLRSKKIGVQVHYIPVHMQPYYQNLGFRVGDFPASEKLYSEIISIPIFPSLTQEQQNNVIRALREELTSNN